MSNYLSRYKLWLGSDKVSEEDKDYLRAIESNDSEIKKWHSEQRVFEAPWDRARQK